MAAKTYLWHLDLVSLLEMSGESFNEVFGWDILDGDSVMGVDDSELNFHLCKRGVFLKELIIRN